MGQCFGWLMINLVLDNEFILMDGVYVMCMVFLSFLMIFDFVMNIGMCFMVYENYECVVEIYVFDFCNDVYGERVEIGFYK